MEEIVKFFRVLKIPKNNKKGKWTPKIEDIEECEKGYHVTPYWNMYKKKERLEVQKHKFEEDELRDCTFLPNPT